MVSTDLSSGKQEYLISAGNVIFTSSSISVEWVAEIEDDVKITLPADIRYSCLPDDKSVETMLAEGELDALFHSDLIKPFVAGDARVARLFPDHKAEEEAYYRKTGIFPIMHVL